MPHGDRRRGPRLPPPFGDSPLAAGTPRTRADVLRDVLIPSWSSDLLHACLADLDAGAPVAWYPSAGGDLRDVLELGTVRRARHGLRVAPRLFIHTTLPGHHLPSSSVTNGFLHLDNRTKVRAARSAGFLMRPEVAKSVWINDAAFDSRFPSSSASVARAFTHDLRDARTSVDRHALDASLEDCHPAKAYLYDVRATSLDVGDVSAWVLALEMSNYDFFLNFVVARRFRFETLIHVREGRGLGGCNVSVQYLYPWLYWAGCRETLNDGEVHGFLEVFQRVRATLIAAGAPEAPPAFRVERTGAERFAWSHHGVSPARLVGTGGRLTTEAEVETCLENFRALEGAGRETPVLRTD